jgi:hypothetical protein
MLHYANIKEAEADRDAQRSLLLALDASNVRCAATNADLGIYRE